MLYIFHGEIKEAGNKARTLVESLRAKRPDAAYEKMDADMWDVSSLEGHLGGQGLFSNKYIVYLDRVTENKEAKEKLADFAEAMQESSNIFIVLESKLTADLKKAFEKHAEKIVEVTAEKNSVDAKEEGFNVFALGNAVGTRDAFKAWNTYRQAVDGGVELEAILGMLFWKAKTSGWKEFAKDVVTLYHEGHRGMTDLELATEILILNCGKRQL